MKSNVESIISKCIEAGYKIPQDLNDVISNSSILIETIENHVGGTTDEN